MEQRGRTTPAASRSDKGGWSIFYTYLAGRGNIWRGPTLLSARAALFVVRLADRPKDGRLRSAWIDALDLPALQRICRQMQKQFWQNPSYVRVTTCESSRYIRALGS